MFVNNFLMLFLKILDFKKKIIKIEVYNQSFNDFQEYQTYKAN